MIRLRYVAFILLCVGLFSFIRVDACFALQPEEVLVIANKKARASVGLAEYYMEKRNVPQENLVQIWVDAEEKCSRKAYEEKIAVPVRRFLKKSREGSPIRCLLLMYGVPLKAAAPPLTEAEKTAMRKLRSRKEELSAKLESADKQTRKEIKQELQQVNKKIRKEENKRKRSSSVDSELALVLAGDYSLSMWQPNPYFVGYQNKDLPLSRQEVLLVSRLDGPNSHTVKRIINDSLEAEAKGLNGTAYFDARWPAPKKEKKSSYGFYDQSIHKAAAKVKKSGKLKVVVEETGQLFQPGDCPQAALYCGWYKLAHYVDAFEWQPGAVGYHIASQECQSLKRGDYWCKRMLEDGVAATLGPVGEPFLQSFPVPEVFFSVLMDGRYTLAEAYALAKSYWSWKMVLVGDPLYRPFKKEG